MKWWGPNVQGDNTAVGDEFTYRVLDVHTCKLRVVELVPNERVVWLVLESTGKIGDGKIFVLDLHRCVRIRTGEESHQAIG